MQGSRLGRWLRVPRDFERAAAWQLRMAERGHWNMVSNLATIRGPIPVTVTFGYLPPFAKTANGADCPETTARFEQDARVESCLREENTKHLQGAFRARLLCSH